jgi:uncharacterized damage-inducible protein DinB
MSLQAKIQDNKIQLLNSFLNLNKEEIEFKPAENVWSVLEVLEHIFMINKAVLKVIVTPALEKSNNTSYELFGESKLNHLIVTKRANKVPAPEFSNPTGLFTTITDAEQNLNSLIDKIVDYINEINIEQETITLKHPILGDMTKVDWIHFMIAHTNRHLLQIEELKAVAKN